MLNSYEAVYENGQLKWLADKPSVSSARVIVTIIEETVDVAVKRRTFPQAMIGKVEILEDIVGPLVGEEDWDCLK